MASETVGGTPLVVYVDQHRKVEGGAALPVYITNLSGGGGGASDVDDLTTNTGNADEMVRVALDGGLEYRTPEQVLSDIGAQAALSEEETEWLTAALAAVPDASGLPNPADFLAEAGRIWKAMGDGTAAWRFMDVAELEAEDIIAGDMIRGNDAGGLEYRTPEQVLGDIGAQAALPEEEAEWLTEAVDNLPDASALQSMPNPADAPEVVSSIWTSYGYGTAGWSEQIQFITSLANDFDTTPGNTRLLLWDVDAGALVRVSVGADDSGGTGYKVLRIPN